MRNSIVPVVILFALLITSMTNARDIRLDDGSSVGICCFEGPKDWPKLDGLTNPRPEIQVEVLDVHALAMGLTPRDDVRPQTILTLAVAQITPGASAPLWHCTPPAADVEFDTIRVYFLDRLPALGISMERNTEPAWAGIISAPLPYASAAFNAN